ncbi:RHS repeat-associated core domain-containing protein [Chryseobacterium mucoviscidosis]|uniref:RHS repeat domain-containing protein n=1 Tax=Chryseobacterium mucoviscidosis TaxID=1945581 RepID=UPI0030197BD0
MSIIFYVNKFCRNNQYIYQYKDHLGNTRVSFGKNSAGVLEIVDANDYYPFGMNHLKSGNSFFGSSSYKNYKYQGQELQETGFYSFKWRNYMPDVGRFFNIDPLSEKYTYQSHYNFSENKVVSHIELEGLEAIDANKIRKVFENGKKGQSYRITIHVDQPGKGGDRDTYEVNKGSGPDPGHPFITLSRKNTDGTTDAKTFGFYHYPPSVNPLASEADGKVKDNYGHEKEVVQSWVINENKFNNVLDFVESKKNTKYDLNTNNCTDFVINAASSAGINLPKTKGTWPNGEGSNPGDLGQDMRQQNERIRKGLPPNPSPTNSNNKKEDNDKKISL